ncbi:alpha/beta fold hydrolase [Geomicrobium sp. JCM 19038]|uniref:alpha/beta hydrolase family protein n=1 Tax=Geomicrobium sp. JCM 19038 TaxID=1460635 RepID=UPI00045F10A4|nr:alpha/beta fold hydrolase [Geomicrobium sp. JCM 19038]GAK08111.1 lipase [Geomicrobium sp. JCM 19038]
MTVFEWIMVGFIAIGVVLLILKKSIPRSIVLVYVFALVGMSIAQLLLDEWRIPMLPLYGLGILVIIILMIRPNQERSLKSSVVWILFLLFVIAIPSYLFPWNQLDKPSGPYQVGTMIEQVDVLDRSEQWSTDDEHRKLMVQFWYPASEVNGGKRAPYHEHANVFVDEFFKTNGIPGFLIQSFAKQSTPIYQDVPIINADNPFPVVFFSHGFGGNRSQNYYQVSELASHGYIVIGIDHTYYSPGTVFKDGTIPGALEFHVSELDEEMVDYLYEWSADAQSVMNWLERIDQSAHEKEELSLLATIIQLADLSRVGYIGHSFGGATAVHTLAVDDRFTAGVNMDGFPYGEAHVFGVDQPFLTLTSDQVLMKNYLDIPEVFDEFLERAVMISGEEKVISLDEALHMDFTDMSLLSPLMQWLGISGTLGAKDQHQIINQHTLDFLNIYLKEDEM